MERYKFRFMAFLVLILVNILFGTGYPLVKEVLNYLSPATWLFVRTAVYTLCLLVFLLPKLFRQKLDLKTIGWLFFGAIFGLTVNQICFAEGLARTIPAHAAMINATIPLQTLVLAWLFLRESIDAPKLIGVGLGLIGIGILLEVDKLHMFNPYLTGDLLTLANCTSYSIFLVIARRALKGLPPFMSLTWMSLFAVVAMGWYADWHFPIVQIIHFPRHILWYMLFLVLVQSIITYVLNLWALKRVTAFQAALPIYCQPIVAALMSFWMLGDVPSERFYISGGLILTGILVGEWRR